MEVEKIHELILTYLSGEYSPDEEKEILAWSNSSKENSDYFQRIKYTWLVLSEFRTEPKFPAEGALDEFHEAMKHRYGRISDKPGRERPKMILSRVLRYAAVFIMVFMTGGLASRLFWGNNQKGLKLSVNRFEIPIGSKGNVVLPDGTRVCLNAGSKLSYSSDYNNLSRNVELSGEGFFEVVTNPRKPFVVHARNLSIKAYGTAFNVKAYDDEKMVTTTLVRGKVFVEGKDKLNKKFLLEMEPNQSVTYLWDNPVSDSEKSQTTVSGKEIEISKKLTGKELPVVMMDKVKTELFTSWKDTRWIVENESLPDLIKELERRYNVVFSISTNPNELLNYHFSGTIQNESIEQVLKILSYALPVKYSIDKDQVNLKLDLELKQKYIRAL